ncbi:MAG: AAA family ATPase [Planctomycetota bacterium]|nr:AAA family ATPase [Planctomycetota bacterium]
MSDSTATPAPAPSALPAEALRWRCDPSIFKFETTDDVTPVRDVVGQDVAVEALRFGLETSAPGQHVFVRGITGTGRGTLVRHLLDSIKPQCGLAPDRCYVFNFQQPDRPRLLTLARGTGEAFRKRMDRVITFVREELTEGLSSDVLKARTGSIEKEATASMEALAKPFEDELREAGLMLMRMQAGPVQRQAIVPVIEGEPAPPERIEALRREEKLSDEDHEKLIEKIKSFTERMQALGEKMQEIQGERLESLNTIITDEARGLMTSALSKLRKEYPGQDVQRFLDAVVEDLVERRLGELAEGGAFAERYRVNVVSSHEAGEGCPTILEHAPSVQALLGTIDRSLDPDDNVPAPQMMIRSGSLLRADGGFLVIEGRDLLMEPGAWKTIIRALRSNSIELVPLAMQGPWQSVALKPDPIPIEVKVVLIGDAGLYYALDAQDSDFRDHFKVLADFETTLPRSDETLQHYARVLARIQADSQVKKPYDQGAVAALCEHGARIAAQPDRITARFGRLADLAREAAYLADKEDDACVTAEHVVRAVRRTKARADLPARRFREMIARGVIRVHTQGKAIGQVNGLAVMSAGPLTYGFPNRITATIGPGTAGTINIDREAELSGAIHTKGFYILGGLLRYLLRTDHPLAFNASVAFEQSYGGIDGDSASGAEMCCLLSALTDLPLDQGLAMTGAIDQVGNILPIGGVNEKIEGFFDACRDSAALTGSQGVIIPQTNAGDLMLRADVVEACAAGRFHIYAVDSIHEALTLFTGCEAGQRGEDGAYPADSVLGIALRRAYDYWKMAIRRQES